MERAEAVENLPLTNLEDPNQNRSRFCIDKQSVVDEYGAAFLDCASYDRKLGIAGVVIAVDIDVCIEYCTQRRAGVISLNDFGAVSDSRQKAGFQYV